MTRRCVYASAPTTNNTKPKGGRFLVLRAGKRPALSFGGKKEIPVSRIFSRRGPVAAAPAPTLHIPLSHTRLPEEVLQALARGWKVFRVDVTSIFASDAAITALISNAIADRGQLEQECAGAPDFCNFAVVTGAESGIFVLASEPEYGGLAARICEAVVGGEDGDTSDDDASTLVSQVGNTPFAFFRYPVGRISRARKQLAPGLTLHGGGGWGWIPPLVHSSGVAHAYRDPNQPVRNAPRWQIDLVFGPPSTETLSPPKRFPPQTVQPTYRSSVSVQLRNVVRRPVLNRRS